MLPLQANPWIQRVHRWHRWLLWSGLGIMLLSFGTYLIVITWPLVVAAFAASTLTGMVSLAYREGFRSVKTVDWATYLMASLGTSVSLTLMLGSSESYRAYGIAAAAFGAALVLLLGFRGRFTAFQFGWQALLVLVVPVAWCINSPDVLRRAVRDGQPAYLRLLLRLGADPNAPAGQYAPEPVLIAAVGKGDTATVGLLLAYGADPNGRASDFFNGTPALFDAVREQGPEMVTLLLRNGAHPDARNNSGETALFHAARFGRLENGRLLLAAGAQVNHRDKNGQTALFSAKSREVAEFLLGSGAKVNLRDNKGQTALFDLSGDGDTTIIERLLGAGLSLEDEDSTGQTVLFSAASYHGRAPGFNKAGRPGYYMVRYLLRKGLSPQARDHRGQTPVDVARKNKYDDLVKLMEQYRPGLKR